MALTPAKLLLADALRSPMMPTTERRPPLGDRTNSNLLNTPARPLADCEPQVTPASSCRSDRNDEELYENRALLHRVLREKQQMREKTGSHLHSGSRPILWLILQGSPDQA